jgi:hypothetical protein
MDRLPVSYGDTAGSSAGQDVVQRQVRHRLPADRPNEVVLVNA